MHYKLRPFNDGKPLRGVRVTLCSGEILVGLLQEQSDQALLIRTSDHVLPTSVPAIAVARIEDVPDVPSPGLAVEDERGHVLGGVGLHTRRRTYADSETGDVGGFVANCHDLQQLRKVMGEFDGLVRFLSEPPQPVGEGAHVYPIVIDGSILPSLNFVFGLQGMYLHCPNVEEASIFCDSLNRAKHLWSQSLKYSDLKDVGPTRALWRFRPTLPPGARRLPFSWPAWADICVDFLQARDEMHRIDEFEMPLRAWVHDEVVKRRLKHRSEIETRLRQLWEAAVTIEGRAEDLCERTWNVRTALRACDARLAAGLPCSIEERASLNRELYQELLDEKKYLEEDRRRVKCDIEDAAQQLSAPVPGRIAEDLPLYVTPCLSQAQSAEQIDAFHAYYYYHWGLSDDQKQVLRARLLHGPLTTGYYVHWNNPYTLSGEYEGYGENLRKRLRKDAHVPHTAARNRMRVDGEWLKGKGSAGYKGLFEPPQGGKAYNPQRQLVRTSLDDAVMRRPPYTCPNVSR